MRKEPTIKRERPRVQMDCGTESRTKQSFQPECDISNILRRGAKTGLVTHVNRVQGSMRDLSGATDYKTGLDLINAARDSFMALPATIRGEFDNDPAKFLEFADNPDNRDRMIMLGLMEQPATERDHEPQKTKSTEADAEADATEGGKGGEPPGTVLT